jgi:hypothetical protein
MGGLFPMPCLDCGVLTKGANRCFKHHKIAESKRQAKKDRSHYRGDYGKRAKIVRESAERCWICGEGGRLNDPWTADHLYAGEPTSPLLPAHRSCNSRRGKGQNDTTHPHRT